MYILQDAHGRTFTYLRLSLTDACNFRCQYCLPNGYKKALPTGDLFEDTLLSVDEIRNLVSAFSCMGFSKVRLTGGEPTLRKDIVEIVEVVAQTPGISSVALTTNGYRLDTLVRPLVRAGLSALNVSLDSLESGRFEAITGFSKLPRVMKGIQTALEAGIPTVKINVVLLRSFIMHDLPLYFALAKDLPVTIRFIELMETADNGQFFAEQHVSGHELHERLGKDGWAEFDRCITAGPAREFSHPAYAGKIGIIAPYAADFCSRCNRLRVSSRGKLKLCLFGMEELSLRSLLQSTAQRQELAAMMHRLICGKKPAHTLHEKQFGTTHTLSGIGG